VAATPQTDVRKKEFYMNERTHEIKDYATPAEGQPEAQKM
jgi:hypothetical protein